LSGLKSAVGVLRENEEVGFLQKSASKSRFLYELALVEAARCIEWLILPGG
jgi:hypothetical protein